ncbi:MAG: methyl-accepting chemotaxis protein, partial [Spirochaetaceae bacterium]|nr:methyl-accepting chemotaxis protein [Spirochaetaceae bacterium]
HAGASGKGFAVVADEIRKLAEQSTSQAKDIARDLTKVSETIMKVRAAADAAVGAFGSILDKSGALGGGVREIEKAVSEQREGGRAVLENLGRLKSLTGEISRGSREMAAGNASILEHVERLKTANVVVVRNNEEVTIGTREINEAVAGTMDLCARNTDLIAEVRAATDKFLI